MIIKYVYYKFVTKTKNDSFISLNFYGWKKWIPGILDNPIYFIFAIFTNISFYTKENHKTPKISEDLVQNPKSTPNSFQDLNEEIIEEKEEVTDIEMDPVQDASDRRFDETLNHPIQEVNSSKIIHEDIVIEDIESSKEDINEQCEEDTSELDDDSTTNDRIVAFSQYQSNVLYFLFFCGSLSSVSLEALVQFLRKGHISFYSQLNFAIIIINIILWADLQIEISLKKGSTTGQNDGWLYEIMSYSNNSLLCFFLIPIFMAKKLYNLR